jgi:peptidoglycan/xylan/chitin deacetylase (PgdA/CDA1 family)
MSIGRLALLAATVVLLSGAILVTVAAPALVGWLLLAVAAYLTLVLAGVLLPGLAMFAPVVCRVRGTRDTFALTFDDGPGIETTRKVLSTLAHYGARATFFVLGAKVRANPDLLSEIAQAGHEIGVHGDTHDRLLALRHPDRIAADLDKALGTIESVVSVRPRLFRPPVGHVSPRTARAARRLGLRIIGWSARARDGLASTTPDAAFRRVRSALRPGAIVLLHDAAEYDQHEPAGVASLARILEEAKRRGLRCVSVSSLMQEHGPV